MKFYFRNYIKFSRDNFEIYIPYKIQGNQTNISETRIISKKTNFTIMFSIYCEIG